MRGLPEEKTVRQKAVMHRFNFAAIIRAGFSPGVFMRTRHAVMLALSVLSIPAVSIPAQKARALEPEKYTVYCANDHIEVSFWDLEQMKVRNGSDVCQFQSYTSYSSALNFAQKNFGGEGASCSC
jgi:hypothetical protein